MTRVLHRALQGVGAAGLVIALSAGPVQAGVGTRLANGDGDTAGLCMSITNAGRGTSVEMEPCNTNAHQGWVLQPVPGHLGTQIVSQDADARGRCLTAHAEGVRVTMDRCAPETSEVAQQQRWDIGYVSDNWAQYYNYGLPTGPYPEYEYQCLDVRANGESNVVQTWQCGPANKGNQLWKWY